MGVNGEHIAQMQAQIQQKMQEYEFAINQKITLFDDLLHNIRDITRSNESVICAEQEIARIKTNMDFSHREIAQKRRVLYDQRQILDDLRAQMREVDEEIGIRDQRIGELEDMVRAKDGEMQDLVDIINEKDRIIA